MVCVCVYGAFFRVCVCACVCCACVCGRYLLGLFTPKLEPDGQGGWTGMLAGEAADVDPSVTDAEGAAGSEAWAWCVSVLHGAQ